MQLSEIFGLKNAPGKSPIFSQFRRSGNSLIINKQLLHSLMLSVWLEIDYILWRHQWMLLVAHTGQRNLLRRNSLPSGRWTIHITRDIPAVYHR